MERKGKTYSEVPANTCRQCSAAGALHAPCSIVYREEAERGAAVPERERK